MVAASISAGVGSAMSLNGCFAAASICLMIASACSVRPCEISHRGDSGRRETNHAINRPGTPADDEHDLPPQDRHQPGSDLSGGHQADWKDHFIKKKEPPAPVRTGELVDVSRGDWSFRLRPRCPGSACIQTRRVSLPARAQARLITDMIETAAVALRTRPYFPASQPKSRAPMN